MKKLITVVLLLVCISIFTLPSAAAADYVVTDYGIDVVLNSNRTCRYTETVTVDFSTPRHGIYRTIPTDGGSKVYNVSVENNDFSVNYYDGYVQIKIGDAERTVTGQNTYVIYYTLWMPELTNKPDTAYLNLIGNSWETDIQNAHITVKLPAEEQSFEGYVGTYGAVGGRERLTVSGQNREVSIDTVGTLVPGEGVTVLIGLPAGTFRLPYPYLGQILFGVAILVLLFVIFLYYRFGKDKRLTRVLEFYPPEGLSPAQAGYLIDRSVENTDVTALIYYWASHGHLAILEPTEDAFSLKRISALDEKHPPYEQEAFEELFRSGNGGEVSLSSLTYQYYKTATKVKTSVAGTYKKQYALTDGKAAGMAVLAGVLVAAMFFVFPLLTSFRIYGFRPSSLVVGAIAAAGSIVLSAMMWAIAKNIFKASKTATFFACLGYGLLALLLCSGLALADAALFLPALAGAAAATVVPFITRRSDYYNSILERLLGFRDFIKTAEKERLEMMLRENPSYYYDILPYAQVLGVSDIWADKFKNITLEPPTWYYGNYHAFNSYLLFTRLHSFDAGLSKAVIPAPKASGGGSFGGGGGGFSGGGFGGGGGGAW